MIKADIPRDEPGRLKSLRSLHILDTHPEERFDRLTRIAKRLFDVPIALISLVDENRQWCKSAQGLDATEIPRDISFCAHAILRRSVLIIPDATKDPRFADNPAVTGDPHVRFYAGYPIEAPDGFRLGTLCIVDTSPRAFSSEDIATLSDLAHIVERELAFVHMVTLDELTRISNRRGLAMLSQHSLHVCVRQNLPAALVFMDLDQFKPINDTFGHAEGDRVLKFFAEQMKKNSRDTDICARLGGDEFAMLLINSTSDLAEHMLARLRLALAQYNQSSQRGYGIAFSHGIVAFNPERHTTIDTMIADGDALMYQLKNQKSGKRVSTA